MRNQLIIKYRCIKCQVPFGAVKVIISSTGKSIVVWYMGTYLDAKGYTRGTEGKLSHPVSYPLGYRNKIKFVEPNKIYTKKDFSMHEFSDGLFDSITVKIKIV